MTKTKISTIEDLKDRLKQANVKFYIMHAQKYFFVDANYIQKKQEILLKSMLNQGQIYCELLN